MTRTILLGFTLLTGATTGCMAKDPMVAWKDRVAHYVVKRGNGDPNVLRDLAQAQAPGALRPTQATIGELGVTASGPTPGTSTRDVQGILLGTRSAASQRWFLFLVGVIARGENSRTDVEDIRLAAFSAELDTAHWIVSPPNAEAMDQYIGRNAAPSEQASASSNFPNSLDAFEIRVADGRVQVRDQHSGASWSLQLQDPEPLRTDRVGSRN